MKRFLLLLIFFIIIGFVFLGAQFKTSVQGSTTDNVYGNAWSSNIGWIKFNNCDYDDPPDPATCSGEDFGVNIDSVTGEVSGSAWSNSIGWLRFDPPGPYPSAGPNYSACLDLPGVDIELCDDVGDNTISGWARFCTAAPDPSICGGGAESNPEGGGWDGWVKLQGQGPAYGVFREDCDLKGFAWGNLVAGWIDFEDVDFVVETTECENSPPSTNNLTVTQADYCFKSSPPIFLNWIFNDDDPGDSQTAYQVQVDNNKIFNSSYIVDSGKVFNDNDINSYPPPGLEYNKNYYWRVKVWDKDDVSSGWIAYTDGAGDPISFHTRKEWPNPSFQCKKGIGSYGDCSEITVSPGDNEVDFRNLNGGYAYVLYEWDFDDDDEDIFEETGKKVDNVKLAGKVEYPIAHRVTEDGTTCESRQIIQSRGIIPNWKEVPPT